jgi:type VI secretion system secreted protein Hcp
MAVDMFLKLGDIKGESKDGSGHKEHIDILAWSWGASNSGTAHAGTGAGAGKVNVQDLSVTKWVDLSSPSILQAVSTGKHIPEVTLYVRKAGEKPLEYITITMKEVMLTSHSLGGSGGEDRLTENVSLNFAKFKFEYKEQLDTGGAGASPHFAFNIAGNVAE